MLRCAARGVRLPWNTSRQGLLARPFCTQKYKKINWLGLQQEIKDLTQQGHYNEAFKIYQDVKRNTGGKPAPYVTLEITHTLDAAKAACQEENGYQLEVDAFNTLIDFSNEHEWPNAVYLPALMQEQDVQPDITTYNNLLDGVLLNGDFKLQERIFMMMQQANITPNADTFNPFIKHHLRVPGQRYLVESIFERMLTDNIPPNNRTAMIMERYYGHKKHRPAFQLFYELLKQTNTTLLDPLPELEDDEWNDYYNHLPPPAFDEEGRPIIPKEHWPEGTPDDHQFPVCPEVLEYRQQQKEMGPRDPHKSEVIEALTTIEEEESTSETEEEGESAELQRLVDTNPGGPATMEEVMRIGKLVRRYYSRDVKISPEFQKQLDEGWEKMHEHRHKLEQDRIKKEDTAIKKQMPQEMKDAQEFTELMGEEKSDSEKTPEELKEEEEGWNKWHTNMRNPPEDMEEPGFDPSEINDWDGFLKDYAKKQAEDNERVHYLYQQYLEDNANMLSGKTKKPTLPNETGEKFYPLAGDLEEWEALKKQNQEFKKDDE